MTIFGDDANCSYMWAVPVYGIICCQCTYADTLGHFARIVYTTTQIFTLVFFSTYASVTVLPTTNTIYNAIQVRVIIF